MRFLDEILNTSTQDPRLLVKQDLRISHDIYGRDTCSADELAIGYPRPISSGNLPAAVPSEILQAHDKLHAKRKLTRIMRSRSTVDIPVNIGDFAQVYINQ